MNLTGAIRVKEKIVVGEAITPKERDFVLDCINEAIHSAAHFKTSGEDPLTKEWLNAMGCANPDCGHDHSQIFLIGGCCLSKKVTALYDKASGLLLIHCARCGQLIVEIAVAAG